MNDNLSFLLKETHQMCSGIKVTCSFIMNGKSQFLYSPNHLHFIACIQGLITSRGVQLWEQYCSKTGNQTCLCLTIYGRWEIITVVTFKCSYSWTSVVQSMTLIVVMGVRPHLTESIPHTPPCNCSSSFWWNRSARGCVRCREACQHWRAVDLVYMVIE